LLRLSSRKVSRLFCVCIATRDDAIATGLMYTRALGRTRFGWMNPELPVIYAQTVIERPRYMGATAREKHSR